MVLFQLSTSLQAQGIVPCGFSNTPINITSNTVWNTPRVVNQDVIVLAPFTLTVTAEVSLSEMASIKVKPGAKLLVDGGKLTSGCATKLWRGVRVEGNPSFAQSLNPLTQLYKQGFIEMKNNAIIEYALVGANLSEGGVIRATNSLFLNNGTGVNLTAYSFKNISSLVRTSFISNNNYRLNTDISTVKGVNASQNAGTRVLGCLFENQISISAIPYLVVGIVVEENASVSIAAFCTGTVYPCNGTLIKTTFQNLYNGIACRSATFDVDQSDFIRNRYGIATDISNNFVITRNTFIVGPGLSSACSNNCEIAGINLVSSSGYRVEENNISQSAGGGSNSQVNNGITVAQGGASENRVYRNSLSGFVGIGVDPDYYYSPSRALFAPFTNKSQNSLTGLQFICNSLSNNHTDLFIPTPVFSDDGLRMFQGSNTVNAGNTFSSLPTNVWNIRNQGPPITYFHGTGSTEPIRIFGLVTKVLSGGNTCPSNFGATTGGPQLSARQIQDNQEIFAASKPVFEQLSSEYKAKIDAGNTIALLSSIKSVASEAQTSEVFTKLLTTSPFVSASALSAVAKSAYFTVAKRVKLLKANPEAVRNYDILEYFKANAAYPLSAADVAAVKATWNNPTARAVLESNLSDASSKMNLAANMLLCDWKNDTVFHHTEIINILKATPLLSFKYDLIEYFHSIGQNSDATQLLSDLPTLFSFTSADTQEYQNYTDFYTFRAGVEAIGRSITKDLTLKEQANLQQIADNSNVFSGYAAQSVLCIGYGNCTKHRYLPVQENADPNSENTSSSLESADNTLYVAPNPASSVVNISYQVAQVLAGDAIVIEDLTGKVYRRVAVETAVGTAEVRLENMPNGLYICRYIQGENSLKISKFIINK